jgi:hypothetical protein
MDFENIKQISVILKDGSKLIYKGDGLKTFKKKYMVNDIQNSNDNVVAQLKGYQVKPFNYNSHQTPNMTPFQLAEKMKAESGLSFN